MTARNALVRAGRGTLATAAIVGLAAAVMIAMTTVAAVIGLLDAVDTLLTMSSALATVSAAALFTTGVVIVVAAACDPEHAGAHAPADGPPATAASRSTA